MDNIIIGYIMGASALGVYNIAYMMTEGFRSQLSRVITSVMLPVYSKYQGDMAMIKMHYLRVTKIMTISLFSILVFIMSYVDWIIEGLFSSEWHAAIVPAQILSAAGLVYAISGPAAEVLQGIGKPKILFKISLYNIVVVGIPSMIILTYCFGIIGSAASMLISFSTMRMLCHVSLRNVINISEYELLKVCLPAISIGVLIAVSRIIIQEYFGVNL